MSSRPSHTLDVGIDIKAAAQTLVDDLAAHLTTDPQADSESQDLAISLSMRRLDLLRLEATDPKIIGVTAYLIAVAPQRMPENPFPDENDDFTGLLDAVRGALAELRPDLKVAI